MSTQQTSTIPPTSRNSTPRTSLSKWPLTRCSPGTNWSMPRRQSTSKHQTSNNYTNATPKENRPLSQIPTTSEQNIPPATNKSSPKEIVHLPTPLHQLAPFQIDCASKVKDKIHLKCHLKPQFSVINSSTRNAKEDSFPEHWIMLNCMDWLILNAYPMIHNRMILLRLALRN